MINIKTERRKLAAALAIIFYGAVTFTLSVVGYKDHVGFTFLLAMLCIVGCYLFWIVSALQHSVADQKKELTAQVQATDAAYTERNHLVALLARLYPSGLRRTNIPGWHDDWHNCVYIDLPAGQISYHFHSREAPLFEGLPHYEKPWDGHTKNQVHAHLIATPTLTGLIPTAWLDHWLAHQAVHNEAFRPVVNRLNQELTDYLATRVFLMRTVEPDWDRDARYWRTVLRQRGDPLSG